MKAQMFMEIILGLSVMILIFIVIINILNVLIMDSSLIFSTEKDDFIESFQLQVILIEQSNHNVNVKFTIPGTIGNEEYNLHLLQQPNMSIMIFNFSSGVKSKEIPKITNLTPIDTPGIYHISKINNKLYLKKE
jgi:hypothetical protein